MIYVYLLVSCIVFIELFILFDVKKEAMGIVTLSREVMGILMSSGLDDDAKEAFMRRASIDTFKATLIISLKFLLIILMLYAMYWIMVYAFPMLRDPILDSFVSPLVIIGLTAAAMVYVWARNVVIK